MINKQELIKNIKFLARESSQQYPHEEMVELPDVLREINKLDEPESLSQELPVIPKHVADWIEENRERYEHNFFSIGRDLYDICTHLDVSDWIIRNEEKFVRAWFNAYEIENEPLYCALIKGHGLIDTGRVYWDYDKSDDSVFISELYSLPDSFLTEMSKTEWNKLGINDSNADFVKVV